MGRVLRAFQDAGPGSSWQLQSSHGQLALPALSDTAARNGTVLGLPSLDDILRELPLLPKGRNAEAWILRPGQTPQPSHGL